MYGVWDGMGSWGRRIKRAIDVTTHCVWLMQGKGANGNSGCVGVNRAGVCFDASFGDGMLLPTPPQTTIDAQSQCRVDAVMDVAVIGQIGCFLFIY